MLEHAGLLPAWRPSGVLLLSLGETRCRRLAAISRLSGQRRLLRRGECL